MSIKEIIPFTHHNFLIGHRDKDIENFITLVQTIM